MEPPATKPPYRKKRISLTKAQLRTELGAELLSLCESITADGQLVTEEVGTLRAWLSDSADVDLPAAQHLREIVARVIADGQITPDECREVYRAVEAVLPPEVRKTATAARRGVEAAERQRNAPIASANFMVAGCRYEGRPAIIEAHAEAGDPVRLRRDSENRFSTNAIAVDLENGGQIGFVPEEDATQLAPLLDQGARCSAHMTKILTGGRSPIPVVQVRLYPADTTLDVDALARSNQTLVVKVGTGRDERTPLPQGRSAGWWILVVALVAAAVAAVVILG